MADPIDSTGEITLAEVRKAQLRGSNSPHATSRQSLRWDELESKTPPIRPWRIAHWMSDGPTLLAGAGGIGKTLLAQTIATALALGRYFLDEVAAPAKVLFWACEDDHDELWRRQIAICKLFDIRLADLCGKLVIEPRLGRENTLFGLAFGQPVWTGLREELRDQINDYQTDAFILDNIGQTFGGNENDRHHVTNYVNGLAGLTNRHISTLILGHPAKANGSEFSGSTAWENAVRMRWFLGHSLPDQKDDDAPPEPDVRYLAKRKSNYSTHDYRKLTYRDGVFVPENAFQSITDRYTAQDRAQAARRCVLDALIRLAEAGIRSTDGATSPDYLPRKMRDTHLAADFSPKDLKEAMHALQLEGQIVEGPLGHYKNRTPRFGLKVAF